MIFSMKLAAALRKKTPRLLDDDMLVYHPVLLIEDLLGEEYILLIDRLMLNANLQADTK